MKLAGTFSLLGSLAVTLCAGSAVAADIVFQQDPVGASFLGPFANFNHAITTQQIADNFSLATAASVSEIAWWGWTYNNQTNDSSGTGNLVAFDVRIMASDGIAGAPSTVIHQETIPMGSILVGVYLPVPLFGGDTFSFSAPLIASVPLAAGTQYWIAINAVVSDTTNSGDLFVWLEKPAPPNSAIDDIALDGLSDPLDGTWVLADSDYNLTFQILAIADTDADGLTDTDETTIWFTNPLDPDTDNDGLLDGTEVGLATCVSPLIADSDGDTLSDGAEIGLGTNACAVDSDGDGIPDPLDALPNTANSSNSQVAEALRGVGDVIESFPLSAFNAPNNNARAARRNALANRYYAAALFAQIGLDLPAAILVFTVELRIDGDSSPPDWMLDSVDRDLLRIFTDLTLDMLT